MFSGVKLTRLWEDEPYIWDSDTCCVYEPYTWDTDTCVYEPYTWDSDTCSVYEPYTQGSDTCCFHEPYPWDSDICSVYEPYTWTRHCRHNTWMSQTKALRSGKTKNSVRCCVQQIWDVAEKWQFSTETICIRLAVGKFWLIYTDCCVMCICNSVRLIFFWAKYVRCFYIRFSFAVLRPVSYG
jgi:hypothetical protein